MNTGAVRLADERLRKCIIFRDGGQRIAGPIKEVTGMDGLGEFDINATRSPRNDRQASGSTCALAEVLAKVIEATREVGAGGFTSYGGSCEGCASISYMSVRSSPESK